MVFVDGEELKVVLLFILMGFYVVVVYLLLLVSICDVWDVVLVCVFIGDVIVNLGYIGLLVSVFYEFDLERFGVSI